MSDNVLIKGKSIEDKYDLYNNLSVRKDGSIDINVQDQTTELIDLYLTKLIDTITLTAQTSLDDRDITFDSNTLPVIGNIVCLKENTSFYQGFIVSVTDNGNNNYTVSLDSPLDYPFTINGGCSINEHNLATSDGTILQEVFSLSPSGLVSRNDSSLGQQWDIVRLMIYIADDSAMDDGLFGNQPALTRGLVIRKKDGEYKNLFNVKTNGEFAQRAYDLRYASQAKPPSGTLYTATTRRTFGGQEKNGVVIRLDSNNNDELQAICQDNLTGHSDIHIIAQGHVTNN